MTYLQNNKPKSRVTSILQDNSTKMWCFLGTKIVFKLPPWKAKCPIFKAIVAGFRGKVALKK